MRHGTLPRDQDGDLFLYLERNDSKLTDQFMGDDFMGSYSSTVKILEKSYLIGLETACFPVYLIDVGSPGNGDYTD
jgi:hypothetical protein